MERRLFFQLVDGNLLYDVNLSLAGVNSYVVNAHSSAIGVTHNFVCSQETVVDIFGCMDMSAITVDNGLYILMPQLMMVLVILR